METRLAWLAAIFGAVAAIGGILVAVAGFWTASETRQQTKIALEQARLDSTGVVTRVCDEVHSGEMRTGDDLFTLTGASGDSDYILHEERVDLLAASSKTPKYYLECRLKNATRVPIFNVLFYTTVSYHRHPVRKRKHNDDEIEVLEPGESRTIWVEDSDNSPVIFHEPDHVQYLRFPDMKTIQNQPLLPLNHYFWTLKRDADPISDEPL
jgi:hypothetical protein